MMAESTLAPEARRGYGPLWAMALIFGLPFVAAVAFYLHPEWLPNEHANRGQLIEPPVATADWTVQKPDGTPLALTEYAGSWLLVTAADPACGTPCETRLYELHQVRRATGVERARVERLALFSGAPTPALVDKLRAGDPHLALGVATPSTTLIPQPLVPGAVIIVDPMGNAILYYAPSETAKNLLKDLKHLLRVSKDWRPPGS